MQCGVVLLGYPLSMDERASRRHPMDSLALGRPLRLEPCTQLKREGIFTCWNLKKERHEQDRPIRSLFILLLPTKSEIIILTFQSAKGWFVP